MKLFMENNTSPVIPNKIWLSGYFEVAKRISGPLVFLVGSHRCDALMKQCERVPGLQINGLCQKLRKKNTFYSNALSVISPAFECPFQPQKYVAKNSLTDLTLFSRFPISGFIWNVVFKMVSGEGSDRETVFCIMAEVKILRFRTRI